MTDGLMGDVGLVAAARNGDVTSFGLLLEQHRADMWAVAVALLGYGPAAEDAVQEAMLIAVQRLHTLINPAAAGPWLKTIVRNVCRMQLRNSRLPTVPLDRDPESAMATAEELLDRHALRDWVWHAVGQLSEPLQLVILLRHFGGQWSYADIAAICGVPIGTVRSRLNQARSQLTTMLRAGADASHEDAAALTGRRGDRLEQLLQTSLQGPAPQLVADLAQPELVTAGWWGAVGPGFVDLTERGAAVVTAGSSAPAGPWPMPDGRGMLTQMLVTDAADSVRERPVEIIASRGVTVMECQLISPPWDPEHCPPAVLWVMIMRDERVTKLRLYHPTPSS